MGRGVRFPGTIEETCSSQGFLSNENKTALYATGWVLGHWTNLAKPRKTKREFNNFDWYEQKEDGRFSEYLMNLLRRMMREYNAPQLSFLLI